MSRHLDAVAATADNVACRSGSHCMTVTLRANVAAALLVECCSCQCSVHPETCQHRNATTTVACFMFPHLVLHEMVHTYCPLAAPATSQTAAVSAAAENCFPPSAAGLSADNDSNQ